MLSFRLNRRTLLRGAVGSVVALPWLEIMEPIKSAHAAPAAAKRYLVCYAGISIGGDGDKKPGEFVPTNVGPNYDLKTALAPLGPAGAQPHVTVVSGMRIPEDDSPAGFDFFHGGIHSPMLTGVRNGSDGSTNPWAMGTSSDQVVADAFVPAALKFKYLPLLVQPTGYRGGPYKTRDSLSFRMEGGKEARRLGMNNSPKSAYNALFSNFVKPGDAVQVAATDLEWRKRRSVLDRVRTNTQRLMKRLGSIDRRRMEQHLSEVRELEAQIAMRPMADRGASCDKLEPITEDQPVGTDGYSNEDVRAKQMCDLMHMAFTCDQTRVGTLMFTMAQSFMKVTNFLGIGTDQHELSHYGGGADTNHKVARAIVWQMKHFAYLVKKLSDTPDVGGSVLDNAAVVFMFEGGHGYGKGDPKKLTSHSGENMACLVAGRAGGLKAGQHLVATGLHPANVLVTCMNAVGVPTQKLGHVSGEIPGLRV